MGSRWLSETGESQEARGDMDDMNSPQYVVRNALRQVLPYWHTNKTFVKGRWLNRTVFDVMEDEFRSRSGDFYREQIKLGRLQIIRNGQAIKGDDVLNVKMENKDILQMTVHKHEPLIVDEPITIIHEDSDLVVVNKPSSIPVHPTGRYYYNTLTEMLKSQLSLSNIHSCYRLDKLTSGVLILAKSNSIASSIQQLIRERDVTKLYLARVKGQFPKEKTTCEKPVGNIDTKLGFKNGVKERKEAKTEFELVRYNPELDQSIVLCKPLTGRTHQIRIHLNYLHHPIVNDPLYGPKASRIRHEMMNSSEVTKRQFDELERESNQKLRGLKREGKCDECQELEFEDPKLDDMVLWLHAYRYKFDKYEFETDEPTWCQI